MQIALINQSNKTDLSKWKFYKFNKFDFPKLFKSLNFLNI